MYTYRRIAGRQMARSFVRACNNGEPLTPKWLWQTRGMPFRQAHTGENDACSPSISRYLEVLLVERVCACAEHREYFDEGSKLSSNTKCTRNICLVRL